MQSNSAIIAKSLQPLKQHDLIVRFFRTTNMSVVLSQFVPKCNPVSSDDVDKMSHFIGKARRLFVLTGAGISTESGIPDYRSENVGLYAQTERRPIQMREFVTSGARRKMYWARNYVSWPRFSSFEPNLNHRIFSLWEKRGKVTHHVTQNVDSLLVKVGCLNLTELHGNSSMVKCLDCAFTLTRDSMQMLIREYNPRWDISSNELAPDNDVQLSDAQVDRFVLPPCPSCKNDRLKPEVVFFGDSIPAHRSTLVNEKLSQCDGLLAAGTSLEVYSAYRIILKAKELNIPVAILNIGKTRGDKHADLKVNSKCSEVLSKIVI
jgi:NAD-dependent deacetylase sirtuin 4